MNRSKYFAIVILGMILLLVSATSLVPSLSQETMTRTNMMEIASRYTTYPWTANEWYIMHSDYLRPSM